MWKGFNGRKLEDISYPLLMLCQLSKLGNSLMVILSREKEESVSVSKNLANV